MLTRLPSSKESDLERKAVDAYEEINHTPKKPSCLLRLIFLNCASTEVRSRPNAGEGPIPDFQRQPEARMQVTYISQVGATAEETPLQQQVKLRVKAERECERLRAMNRYLWCNTGWIAAIVGMGCFLIGLSWR